MVGLFVTYCKPITYIHGSFPARTPQRIKRLRIRDGFENFLSGLHTQRFANEAVRKVKAT